MSPLRSILASPFFLACICGALSVSARAQCSNPWLALGAGTNGSVFALATLPNGDLVAGGGFSAAGPVFANNIARWDGTSWSALGSGTNSTVHALTVIPNGDLVAGGSFTTAGGVSANNIARWDGSSWSSLGTGTNGDVVALTTMPNGGLVAGGTFTTAGGVSANFVARWDGTSWSPLGSGTSGYVLALTTMPNGDLVAGGFFTNAGNAIVNSIARWDGTNWHSMGSGTVPNNLVRSLLALPDGNLVAGSNTVELWDGSSWSSMGWAGPGLIDHVNSLRLLPNGDLVGGGAFIHPWANTSGGIVGRWDGASWSVLAGVSLYPALPAGGSVRALAMMPNGELVAGGDFVTAGAVTANNIASLTTTCPATITPYGTGCTGSAGPNVLTATNLPWTGSTFRATATGLTNNALALSLFGLTATSGPLPQGAPGCTLDISYESVQLLLPTAGSADTQLVIPNSMTFAGVVVHHQVIAAELDAQLNITTVTSTNALTLTIGTF